LIIELYRHLPCLARDSESCQSKQVPLEVVHSRTPDLAQLIEVAEIGPMVKCPFNLR
jgi:hypothetical protein